MSHRRALTILSVVLGTAWSSRAAADTLDKLEKSHAPARPSSSSSSTSSSSSSSSSGSPFSLDTSSSGGDFTLTCLVPGPWTGYCIYGERWLRADRSERAQSLAPVARRTEEEVAEHSNARRYGEASASGFGALNQAIYGFDLAARAWFGLAGLDVSWLRLQEPGSATLPHVDLLRGALVGAFLAEKFVEAHLLLGADVLHGRSWTPAFGAGMEVRVYPTPRFNVVGSCRASAFFEAGDPLFDSRLEAGMTFGRIDARLGGRWLYQADTLGIVGPTASVLIRLGP